MNKKRLYVKENQVTIANGSAGCRAFIEREYEQEGVKMLQVLALDEDGGKNASSVYDLLNKLREIL